MEINCDLSHKFMSLAHEGDQERLADIHHRLHSGETPYAGWVTYPKAIEESLVAALCQTADTIIKGCTAFVVIGIGGSYLGAKAGLELLQAPFYNEHHAPKQKMPKIYFAGHHLSSLYYRGLLDILSQEEVTVCVISKSGGTLEPMVVFEVFKDFLKEKYGEHYHEHIYAITSAKEGLLYQEAHDEGYHTFAIPEGIGGRYSVLTAVGLLPLAVGGIDIVEILQGAREAQQLYGRVNLEQNACYQYALARHVLEQQGKTMEIFEVYDGELRYFTEWLKQLFGESGCKDGKGLFPASLQMSTDLHSMGQFLQEGRQNFFETAVVVDHIHDDFPLPEKFRFGSVATMHQLNGIIGQSVKAAHAVNETPHITITLPDISPKSFGMMVYFFEMACAVSCYLDEVNPFDQPGVEGYKKNIKEAMQIE